MPCWTSYDVNVFLKYLYINKTQIFSYSNHTITCQGNIQGCTSAILLEVVLRQSQLPDIIFNWCVFSFKTELHKVKEVNSKTMFRFRGWNSWLIRQKQFLKCQRITAYASTRQELCDAARDQNMLPLSNKFFSLMWNSSMKMKCLFVV